jgi:hypothetical protein
VSHPLPARSLAAAVEHQDDLLIATSDLDRLATLLAESFEALQAGLLCTLDTVGRYHDECRITKADYEQATACITPALTALQAQDIASQLIAHTSLRLRRSAHRLANEAFADDDEEQSAGFDDAPLRHNPVAQADMETGSIELF